MFCVIREYKMKSRLELDGLIEQIRNEFVPMVSKAPGFAAYTVTAADNGDLITVGFFSDRAGADESVELAKEWVGRNVSSTVDWPPRITSGEVVVMDGAPSQNLGIGVMRRMKLKPNAKSEFVEMLRSKVLPIVKQTKGFVRMAAIDAHADEVVVIAAYKDRESAKEAGDHVMAFMEKNGMHLVTGPPEMLDGTIKLRQVNEAAFG